MIRFGRKRPEIHVMAAMPDDMASLADIHAASFTKAWSEDEIERLASAPGGRLFVARLRGKGDAAPLGFVLIRNSGPEAEIITIAIDPGRRRYGAGRALMGHAIREMQRERAETLFLEVDSGNRAAIALYHSLGFRQVATRKGYYSSLRSKFGPDIVLKPSRQDQGVDALVMSLDLR
jgi:[ribosomal protein S18]-alanine N-acetyltransferase